MRYLKITGLCLVAALALSVVASASAAELELVNKSGVTLVKNKFKGESGKGVLEATNGSKIECTKTKFEGHTISTKEGEGSITFTGCKGKGFPCNTAGSKSEEIKTTLTIIPVLLFPGDIPGLLLTILPQSTASVTLECTGLQKLKVRHGLVIPVRKPAKIGTLAKIFTIEAKQSKGVQQFTKYKINSTEAEKEDFLETEASGFVENFAYKQSGEETGEVEVEFEEEAELKEN